jgi:PAS domain S-box-containing protein
MPQVIGVLGVGQDITERKMIEVEKANVAQELQTFIDTANAPIFGIDHNGLVNEWNNKSVEITGYTGEEVMGQSLVEVYISEDFRASVKSVFDTALDGKGTANFEFPIFTKDRRRIEILLNATPRCNVKGEVCTKLLPAASHFEFSLHKVDLLIDGYSLWEVVEPDVVAELCRR